MKHNILICVIKYNGYVGARVVNPVKYTDLLICIHTYILYTYVYMYEVCIDTYILYTYVYIMYKVCIHTYILYKYVYICMQKKEQAIKTSYCIVVRNKNLFKYKFSSW